MKQFLLVFRRDHTASNAALTPEQLQQMMKPWQDWMATLAAAGKLADPGNRLSGDGRVVKPGKVISNGPYIETKEAIGGYITVNADSIDEAAELAKGCPILSLNGSVEVRMIVAMDNNS